MQGFSSAIGWAPAVGTLGQLTAEAYERAERASAALPELVARAADARPALPFAGALRTGLVSLIAEVKRASPSKGAIAPDMDASARAMAYALGGAAAISVLTEPTRFGGTLSDLAAVAAAVSIPAIRKDFIVDRVQLWEARAAGASAALLIARAVGPDGLDRLMDGVRECGLEAIVEVRDEQELGWAVAVDAMVIGVNNRNLETLVIDVRTAPGLIGQIPRDRIAVAESGMHVRDDVVPAAQAGADAILVGSALSASGDPAAALREFTSIARVPR